MLSFCLFVFLWLARLSEVVILFAYYWVDIFLFVCCLDEASCTGCYWWLGYARSCIQAVSLVWILLRLPSVSSLIFSGLGVCAPTPKSWGLLCGHEQRFYKRCVIALSRETRDELQTNGNYKIRQIIIKIMEYTHTHTHIYIHKQSQNSATIIKHSRLTQQAKEIKNYIYQLRIKVTKAQTRKQN